MSTALDLSEYGISIDTDSYAEDSVIDRVTDSDVDAYDSFHGIDLRTIHHSSDNPLNALYQQVTNASLSLEDRKRAFNYMYHSSYLSKDSICTNALLGVLKDESLTLDDRFHFLNSIRLQSSNLSVAMHGYVWWFYQHGEPLRYRLLSAQFILAHPINEFPLIKVHILQSQRFLKQIAEDEKEDVQNRSEAADMLIRLGTPNFRAVGQRVIGEGVQRQTVYDDEQNVHQVEYHKALKNLVDTVGETVKEYSVDEILHHLRTQQNLDACDSLERIVLDTATYQGYTMAQILQYVYAYVQKSPHKIELENRFVEELVEMKGWCSTGHVVRLLNTMAGFDSKIELHLTIEKEVKAALFARLGFHLRKLPAEQQDEIAQEFCSEEKSLLLEFIETYTPYEELLVEYANVPREEFQQYYDKAVKEYMG